MTKLILISEPDDIHTEDSGMAKIAEIAVGWEDIFVRIHSWRDDKNHEKFDALISGGKVIKVTIEEA